MVLCGGSKAQRVDGSGPAIRFASAPESACRICRLPSLCESAAFEGTRMDAGPAQT
jgi:hypothetical protein